MTARRATTIALLASFSLLPARLHLLAQRLVLPDPARESPASSAAPSPVSVRINAVVTDLRGRPLVDLKPGDFELQDNGIAQTLASVELRTVVRDVRDLQPVLSDDDERRAAQHPGTRVFALFLDEFNVAPGETSARVREALTRFMTEHVRPGDLVHVLKPMEPGRASAHSHREVALRAIERFEGSRGLEPRPPFETSTSPYALAVTTLRADRHTVARADDEIGNCLPHVCALLICDDSSCGVGGAGGRLPDGKPGALRQPLQLPIYRWTTDPSGASDAAG